MEIFLGQNPTMPQRVTKSKLKGKKQQDSNTTTAELEAPSSPPAPQTQNQELLQALEPLLDQKLAGIKESVTETFQLTNQLQWMTDADQRISDLEDNLDKAETTIETQQHET
ncbi:hypothetical protein XELAEV_18029272mg [Xenopus laevis]|uniref:Uncharacterized protein n=1 Tax=Xenopus laevis TaxID=8355 RepID=A0A974CST5_XENLA|nr:hypothetical protein XELAEV_18029272mg [Xenopus laevis]